MYPNFKHGMFKKRKRMNADEILKTIGHICLIHPIQIQLYDIRLILNHVRGPTSYEDIRTGKGITYEPFQATDIAQSIVKNDKIWIGCIMKANDSQTSIHSHWNIFFIFFLNCEVSKHK